MPTLEALEMTSSHFGRSCPSRKASRMPRVRKYSTGLDGCLRCPDPHLGRRAASVNVNVVPTACLSPLSRTGRSDPPAHRGIG